MLAVVSRFISAPVVCVSSVQHLYPFSSNVSCLLRQPRFTGSQQEIPLKIRCVRMLRICHLRNPQGELWGRARES